MPDGGGTVEVPVSMGTTPSMTLYVNGMPKHANQLLVDSRIIGRNLFS